MISQLVTITAPAGALHIVAIWKSIRASKAGVSGWSTQIKYPGGPESITLYVNAASIEVVKELVMALNDPPSAMTVSLVPVTSQPCEARDPASSQKPQTGLPLDS